MLGQGYINTPRMGLAAHDLLSFKDNLLNFALRGGVFFLNAQRPIYRAQESPRSPSNPRKFGDLSLSPIRLKKIYVQIGIGFVQNWVPILRGDFGIAVLRIRKILFHTDLQNFEIDFECRLNHLNWIFELNVIIKIWKPVHNPNLNPIRFCLQFEKFRFNPFFYLIKLNHIIL